MMFRHESARKLYPNVITTVGNKSYDSSGNLVNVDEDLVLKENVKLEAEWDAQAYARTRHPLYPDIGDQLDDLYHKGAFSTEMAAKIKKVKDDNPKG